jgi:VWFA-related protein
MKIRIYLLFSMLLPVAALAQQAAPTSEPAPQGMHLDVAVTTKSGSPVTGLTQQDFTILDNKSVRPITSFKAVSNAQDPEEVILLFDAVNAPFTTVTYERNEAAKFLMANGGHLAHPTTIGVLMDKGPQLVSGFSSDGKEIADALNHVEIGLRENKSDSGFYAANERMTTSLNALNKLAYYAATLPGRKIIIWISPGWPMLSGVNVRVDERVERWNFQHIIEFSHLLQQTNVTLYDINPLGAEMSPDTYRYHQYLKGVSTPYQTDAADLALQVLTVQSGGLSIEGSTDIVTMLQNCYADIGSWYEVTFDPPPGEGPNKFHQIDVKLDKPDLTARTRDGYYTPDPAANSPGAHPR